MEEKLVQMKDKAIEWIFVSIFMQYISILQSLIETRFAHIRKLHYS